MDERATLAAIDELLAANVAGPTDVPRRYRFRHPLVRRAVYDGAGEAWRLEAHARAARGARRAAGRAGGARATTSSARRGSATRPPPRCSSRPATRPPPARPRSPPAGSRPRCGCSARRWRRRSRRPAAGRVAHRPPGAPAADAARVDPGRRLALLVPLAGALAATGRLERALETLVEALALVELPDLRVRLIAACAACENLLGRHDAAHARLLHALEALDDQDGAAAAALHAELAADALYDSDFEAMRQWATRAAETARRLEDRGLEALATALLCFAEYNRGDPEAAEAAREHAAPR